MVKYESKYSKLKKAMEIQPVRPSDACGTVKYKVRKMAKNLLKHHCDCPMLLMRPPKQPFVYKQRPLVITLMDFNWCFR